MKTKYLMLVCWVLLGIMAATVFAVVSPLREPLHIPGDLSNYVTPLGVLGVLLVILAAITKMSRLLKTFLIVAGASAFGWPLSLFVHALLSSAFPTEGITYVMVFFIFPVTFLIGVIGSVVIGVKRLMYSR
jgi:hypothetical protein